jgi:hypothetical protein
LEGKSDNLLTWFLARVVFYSVKFNPFNMLNYDMINVDKIQVIFLNNL